MTSKQKTTMHNDKHHNMEHSAHELMTVGHKAVEEMVQQRVAKQLEEKYAEKLDSIAEHVADGVGSHLKEMVTKSKNND